MDVEKGVMLYLHEYGNTRESDIINYGVKEFNYSSKRIKKVIKRIVIKGKIHFIVHSKLEPPAVYISLKEPLPPKLRRSSLKR